MNEPIIAAERLSAAHLWREGLRIFFPVAAVHLALWPVLWVVVFSLDLALARTVPTSQWHAYEMLVGGFGAALAGFLTSSVPSWTDTPPRRGPDLKRLLALWAPGRVVGLLGADALLPLAIATDAAFLGLLGFYIVKPMIARRSARQAAFVFWLAVLAALSVAARIAWLAAALDVSARLLEGMVHVYIVLFALALGRINVVVLNLALDPSGDSTPYRPHPGRQNLAAAMVVLSASSAALLPGSAVPAWLAFAAAAAFFDRIAEWFIGRAALRPQVIALGAANALAGLGYAVLGLSYFLPEVPRSAGIHALTVGGLGLAIMSVFVVAGLRHTGRDLVVPPAAQAALLLVPLAAVLRVGPELGAWPALLGRHHAAASLVWAAAFLIWLKAYLPFFLGEGGIERDKCG